MLEENRELLNAYGIKGKMQDISILDYPEIKKWFKGENGDLVLSNEKGLILHGGWEAIKIGYAIQRWFVLAERCGAVLDLWEFAICFDNRCNEKGLFIENFQNFSECPLNALQTSQVENFIRSRYIDNSKIGTILHCSTKDLSWYSPPFQEFINNCFLWIDIDQGIRPTKSGN